jgi:hypothetical protein
MMPPSFAAIYQEQIRAEDHGNRRAGSGRTQGAGAMPPPAMGESPPPYRKQSNARQRRDETFSWMIPSDDGGHHHFWRGTRARPSAFIL